MNNLVFFMHNRVFHELNIYSIYNVFDLKKKSICELLADKIYYKFF
jgi:hypothetical protein